MQREFDGKDITVVMLGNVINVSKMSYSASQEKSHKYVVGKADPHTMVTKNKKYKGQMTLLQSELEALQRSLPPGKDPLDIAPFTVLVSYLDENTGFNVTERLESCAFTELEKGFDPEMEGMEIDMEMIVGKITYNVQ